MTPTVADCLAEPAHAGALDGADAVGEARGGGRLLVRIGLWLEGDRVARARFRSSTCASLIACAEVACRLLEAGVPPAGVDAAALLGEVAGMHPLHRDRAGLVATALRAARAAAPREAEP